jgi:hypothetical protein
MSVKPFCIFLSILTPGDEHEMNADIRTTACAMPGKEQALCQSCAPACKYLNIINNQTDID